MAPLSAALAFGVVGLVLVTGASLIGWRPRGRVELPLGAVAFAAAWLALIPLVRDRHFGLHPIAAALVSLGLATLVARGARAGPGTLPSRGPVGRAAAGGRAGGDRRHRRRSPPRSSRAAGSCPAGRSERRRQCAAAGPRYRSGREPVPLRLPPADHAGPGKVGSPGGGVRPGPEHHVVDPAGARQPVHRAAAPRSERRPTSRPRRRRSHAGGSAGRCGL